jgi:hypothetical protein
MKIASSEERSPPLTICSVVDAAAMTALSLISVMQEAVRGQVPDGQLFLQSNLPQLDQAY